MPNQARDSRLRTAVLAATLAFAVLAAVAPAPAAAAEVPRVYYRDRVWKFSFKIFRDWKQVPLEAGEKIQVCKFMDDVNAGQEAATLLVVRIPKGERSNEPVVTGPGGQALPPWMRGGSPASAWDAIVGRLMIPDDQKPDPEDFDDIESKDDVEGKVWQFQIDYGYGGYADHCVLISFENNDIEYGIFLTCPRTQKNKYKRGFLQVGKTFQFIDDKAEEVESLDILEGLNITARRRRDIEAGMVKGWDVIVSPKKNYIIIYNTKNNRNNQLAKEISERIESIREKVYEVQFPPAQPIDAVSIVRVCGDRAEYHAYGGPGGSAGYWNSGSEELVFYDAAPKRRIDDDTVSVLYHEAFHQYIFYSVGNVAPHSWFNEGHGDYYAGAEYKRRDFDIKPFEWRRGVIKNAVAHGPRAVLEEEGEDGETKRSYANDGGYTPLKDLVTFTQGQYYSYPSISYAQGWSLVYFLREVVPKNRKYREKWGHILETYFDTLKAEVNRDNPLQPGGSDDDDGEGGDDEGPLPPRPSEEPPEPPTTPGGEGDGTGEPGDGDEEPEGPGIPMLPPEFFRGFGGSAALQKAVEAAFDGIDWEEFEEAWAKAVKRDM